jgi:invasion protein IalB
MARPIIALLMLTLLSAAAQPQSAWVKLCETQAATVKNKEGGGAEKGLNVCLTHHEHLDDTGKVLFSAAFRQVEGQEKQAFMVMVPLGVLLAPGLRATILPKEIWQKVQRNEKIEERDEAKLKRFKFHYTLCHAAGCTAETEATPELIADLKVNGGLMVYAAGVSAAYPIPLAGFAEALAGEPVQQPMRCDQRNWPGCKYP